MHVHVRPSHGVKDEFTFLRVGLFGVLVHERVEHDVNPGQRLERTS